ncbi:MAG: RNA polymerase sigma-70 factor [Bacteroidales bacterium]
MPEPKRLDKSVLKSLKLGDSDAFREVYDFYFSRLYSFIFNSVRQPNVSEEILQEVFVKLWVNHKKIDPDKCFNAYMYVIARNSIVDYYQKNIVYKLLDSNHNNFLFKEEPSFVKDIITKDILKMVVPLLNEQPPRRREAFILSRFHNLTYKEIAAKMGISENSVDTHIRLVLKYMRSKIGAFLFTL